MKPEPFGVRLIVATCLLVATPYLLPSLFLPAYPLPLGICISGLVFYSSDLRFGCVLSAARSCRRR